MWPFSSSEAPVTDPSQSNALKVPLQESPRVDHNVIQALERPPEQLTDHHERLGLLFPLRLPIVAGAAFFGGVMLGGAKGGYIAADRYRAENAHRLPISRSGWYLYHKSKNYHTTVGSLKEGVKQGTTLMAWAALFATSEEVIDRARGHLFSRQSDERDEDGVRRQRDVLSTVMAGFTVSGLYSWRQGFDPYATARMAKLSLKYSFVYGLLQDTLATLQGDRPGYVDWAMRNAVGSRLARDPI